MTVNIVDHILKACELRTALPSCTAALVYTPCNPVSGRSFSNKDLTLVTYPGEYNRPYTERLVPS